jgi:hypothetical protein
LKFIFSEFQKFENLSGVVLRIFLSHSLNWVKTPVTTSSRTTQRMSLAPQMHKRMIKSDYALPTGNGWGHVAGTVSDDDNDDVRLHQLMMSCASSDDVMRVN